MQLINVYYLVSSGSIDTESTSVLCTHQKESEASQWLDAPSEGCFHLGIYIPVCMSVKLVLAPL